MLLTTASTPQKPGDLDITLLQEPGTLGNGPFSEIDRRMTIFA